MHIHLLTFIVVIKRRERLGITYANRMHKHQHTYKQLLAHMCAAVCSLVHTLSLIRSVSTFSSQSSNIDLTIPSHFETSSVFYVRSMRTVLKLFKFQFLLKKRQTKIKLCVCVYIFVCLWTHFSLRSFFYLCLTVWKVSKIKRNKKRGMEPKSHTVKCWFKNSELQKNCQWWFSVRSQITSLSALSLIWSASCGCCHFLKLINVIEYRVLLSNFFFFILVWILQNDEIPRPECDCDNVQLFFLQILHRT